MPKGYLVANIRVNDPDVFKKFSQTALPIIEQYVIIVKICTGPTCHPRHGVM